MRTKKQKLAACLILGNLLLTAFIFAVGNRMTPSPGQSSGNGNPVIMLFLPLALLFIVLVYQWIATLRRVEVRTPILILLMLFIIVLDVIGIRYQMDRYDNYRHVLAEAHAEEYGFVDWEYIDSISSGLSFHMNNQYFNMNTYFIYISLSIFIWALYRLLKDRIKN